MLFVGLLYEAFEQEVVFGKLLMLIFSNMFSENQVESYGNNFESSHHKWYPIFLTSLLALAQVQGGFSEPLEENKCGEGLEQCFTFQCWWILYHCIIYIYIYPSFWFFGVEKLIEQKLLDFLTSKNLKRRCFPSLFFFWVGSCFLIFLSWTLMSHHKYPDVGYIQSYQKMKPSVDGSFI